jgi:hypothetical protein
VKAATTSARVLGGAAFDSVSRMRAEGNVAARVGDPGLVAATPVTYGLSPDDGVGGQDERRDHTLDYAWWESAFASSSRPIFERPGRSRFFAIS